MAVNADFWAFAAKLIELRLAPLRHLTFAEAAALPEAQEERTRADRSEARINTFRQLSAYQLEGRVLVTVQVSRSRLFGMFGQHIARGLVFSPTEPTRDATDLEIQNSGG